MGSVLAEHTESRDNNFNLLRLLAAGMVLVGHSYPLSGTSEEPLFGGLSLGYVAVDIFFVTSGLLVTRSLLTRGNVLAFAWARCLRIYPALLVAVLLCAVPLGLAFTELGAREYLGDDGARRFVLRNSTLLQRRIEPELPGVFEQNPFPGAVNGSLWTLPWELRMYASLGALGLLAGLLPRRRRTRGIELGVLSLAVVATLGALGHEWAGWGRLSPSTAGLRLAAMFFIGGSFYVVRRHVVLSHWAFGVGALGLIVLQDHPRPFFLVYMAALGYLVLYLAYIPGGAIRAFNRLGDYSYGLYIYAFPVQQSLAATQAGIGPWSMSLQAGAVTLALAVASWYLIEAPALRRKDLFRRSARV